VIGREPDTCSAPYRVRFDEAGPDGLLRTSVVLRYAQDVAWHHSATRGFGRGWYAERGLTWLVRAAEVHVLARIAVGSEIIGTTQVVGWRRVWARRRTDFRDPAGNLMAWTQIDWVLLDRNGSPTRIPSEFDAVFAAPIVAFGLARVAVQEPPLRARTLSLVVRPQELDPLDHVNNAVYADWLDEAVIGSGDLLATRAVPRLARLEYAAPAAAASQVQGSVWREDDGWSFLVRDVPGHDLLRARLEPGAASDADPIRETLPRAATKGLVEFGPFE
jgi:acyl-ACP thioesterase